MALEAPPKPVQLVRQRSVGLVRAALCPLRRTGGLLEPAEDPVQHVQRTGAAAVDTLMAPISMLQQRRWAT